MRAWIFIVGTTLCLAPCQAQEIARVTNVVAFATTGIIEAVDSQGVRKVYEPSFDEASANKTEVVAATFGSATAEVRKPGASLITGENSAASLHLGTAGGVRMGAATEVRVPADTERTHSLEMLKGRLYLDISGDDLKKRNTEFKLKTPAALLAVKGTRFYATSKDGTDTIGVHAGRIMVRDGAGKNEVELVAGTVVTVGPDGVSIPRQMTVEELAAVAEYAAAAVIQTALPQNTGANPNPAVTGLVWSALQKHEGKRRDRSGDAATVITAGGGVRFTWPLKASKAATAHVAEGLCGGLAALKHPVIGMALRLRAIGATALDFKLALSDAPDAAVDIQILPSGSEWIEVMIPFPVSPGNAGFKNGLLLTMRATPAERESQSTASAKTGALEIQSAILICFPQ